MACGLVNAACLQFRPPPAPVPEPLTGPYHVAWTAAAFMEGVARVTRRPPAVPLTAVRMARKRMFFSAAKAVRELGLPQTPASDALSDAVEWFKAHGYVGIKRSGRRP